MLKVIMLSVDMLIVVMPSVVMLSVVAPTKRHDPSYCANQNECLVSFQLVPIEGSTEKVKNNNLKKKN
jgi:hypothetical protein